MNQQEQYRRDLAYMNGWDIDGQELGAAVNAGAADPEFASEIRLEMDQALRRIRAYERAHQLPKSQWRHDGSRK